LPQTDGSGRQLSIIPNRGTSHTAKYSPVIRNSIVLDGLHPAWEPRLKADRGYSCSFKAVDGRASGARDLANGVTIIVPLRAVMPDNFPNPSPLKTRKRRIAETLSLCGTIVVLSSQTRLMKG
jgi:hypothetical protein